VDDHGHGHSAPRERLRGVARGQHGAGRDAAGRGGRHRVRVFGRGWIGEVYDMFPAGRYQVAVALATVPTRWLLTIATVAVAQRAVQLRFGVLR
jgi:hypothetical protein